MTGLTSPSHIAILLVVLLLVFGAKRLPELGRSLGHGLREFRHSVGDTGSVGPADAPTVLATAPVEPADATAVPATAPVEPADAPAVPSQSAAADRPIDAAAVNGRP